MLTNIWNEWDTGEHEARRLLANGATKADLETLADAYEDAGRSSAAEAVDRVIEDL